MPYSKTIEGWFFIPWKPYVMYWGLPPDGNVANNSKCTSEQLSESEWADVHDEMMALKLTDDHKSIDMSKGKELWTSAMFNSMGCNEKVGCFHLARDRSTFPSSPCIARLIGDLYVGHPAPDCLGFMYEVNYEGTEPTQLVVTKIVEIIPVSADLFKNRPKKK